LRNVAQIVHFSDRFLPILHLPAGRDPGFTRKAAEKSNGVGSALRNQQVKLGKLGFDG
jgi:hypothetical protein